MSRIEELKRDLKRMSDALKTLREEEHVLEFDDGDVHISEFCHRALTGYVDKEANGDILQTMAYPEPNSFDDIYGPGAEAAEAFAEDLEKVAERATQALTRHSMTEEQFLHKELAKAMKEDHAQFMINCLTPDRGYPYPTDNVRRYIDKYYDPKQKECFMSGGGSPQT